MVVSKIMVEVIWVKTKVLSDKMSSNATKVFPPLQFLYFDHYTPPIVLHVSVYEGEGPGVGVDAVLVAVPRNPPPAHAPADAGLGVALGGAGEAHVAPLAGHQQRPGPLLDPRPGGQDVHNHILGRTGDGYCTNTDTNYSLSLIYLKKILEIQFCECTKYIS